MSATAARRTETPVPEQETPVPEQETPVAEQKTPEPEQKTPEPEQKTPEPEQETPEPEQKTPEPEQKTPEPEQKTPEPEQKTPEPEQKTPEPEQKTPEPEQKTPEPEQKTPVVELVETTPSTRDRVLTWALLLVALCVLVAGALTWWRATGHDQEMVDEAALRDRVLIVATSHIETLNTLDYRKVDAGLKGWAAVTTGTLHDQLTSVSEEDRTVLAEQEKISTGSVMDAAVTELDDDSATVIAAVEITVRDGSTSGADAEPTVKRNRFAADLVKVGDDWLLESLEQVAVNMS